MVAAEAPLRLIPLRHGDAANAYLVQQQRHSDEIDGRVAFGRRRPQRVNTPPAPWRPCMAADPTDELANSIAEIARQITHANRYARGQQL